MTPLPDDIRRFILTSIPSVPYLEAALLLRAHRERRYTAMDVAQHLYMPERPAAELLVNLCAAGIVECAVPGDEPQHYRYAPSTEALERSMDALAACYAINLLGVTNLIHDTTQKSAHQFADAFTLRKDP
jgi:hypothetical protein